MGRADADGRARTSNEAAALLHWLVGRGMVDETRCPQCGAALLAAGAGCPRCLLALGLETTGPSWDNDPARSGESLTRLPDRVVCGAGWHPSFLADDQPDSPHLTASEIAGPLFLGIGEADEVQSIAMHQRFLDAVAGMDHVTVTTFPGADHGYTWPGYPNYDETAAETSWATTLDMLADTLG